MSYLMDAVEKTDNVFFVGKQDIEDSLNPEIWVEIINKFYNGEIIVDLIFIQDIIDGIPEGKDVQSNQKFFEKLSSLLRKKWIDDGNDIDQFISIPSKGKDSAEFILSNLNNPGQIPKPIQEAFNKLK